MSPYDPCLEYMHPGRQAALLSDASDHLHLQSGFPFLAEPGECEVCDILWLIENEEGSRLDNYFHLRDALEELS